MINDKLWNNLYWTATLTRPDRLAKILNLIIRKRNDNSETFTYNREAVRDAMKNNLTIDQQDEHVHLTHYDKLRLGQIDQQFDGKKTSTGKGHSGNSQFNSNDLHQYNLFRCDKSDQRRE